MTSAAGTVYTPSISASGALRLQTTVLAEEHGLLGDQRRALVRGTNEQAGLRRERSAVLVVVVQGLVEVPASQRAGLPAEQPLGRGVGELDGTARIEPEHRLAHVIGDGLQKRALPLQGQLGLPLGGAIAQDLEVADHHPGIVFQRHQLAASPEPGAVLLQVPALARTAPVGEAHDALPVRAPAALETAPGPAEADHGRQLAPVDRVEEAVLAPAATLGVRLLPRSYGPFA